MGQNFDFLTPLQTHLEHVGYHSVKNNIEYWRCSNRKCPGLAKREGQQITIIRIHNHKTSYLQRKQC